MFKPHYFIWSFSLLSFYYYLFLKSSLSLSHTKWFHDMILCSHTLWLLWANICPVGDQIFPKILDLVVAEERGGGDGGSGGGRSGVCGGLFASFWSSLSLSSILTSILLGFLLSILGVFTHLRNIWHVPSYVSEIAGPVTHVCI